MRRSAPIVRLFSSLFVGTLVFGMARTVMADQVYITDFAKSNNIYNHLNQQFPSSEHGSGGSFVFVPPTGAPNPPPSYAPNYVNNSNLVNNGINFDITADPSGNDYGVVSNGTTSSIATSLVDASAVYAIVGSYDSASPGGIGGQFTVTFTGINAHGGTDTETFDAADLPDYYNGDGKSTSIDEMMTNQSANDELDQTLFKVDDVGGSYGTNSTNGHIGNYDITELTFKLDSALAADTLTNIQFKFADTSGSSDSAGEGGLIYGITAQASTTPLPSTLGAGFILLGGLAATQAVMRRGRATAEPI